MQHIAIMMMVFILGSCAHKRSRVVNEVSSFGSVETYELNHGGIIGVMWTTDAKVPFDQKTILNHLAQRIVDEAELQNFTVKSIKTDEDYKTLLLKEGYLVYPTFSTHESNEYVPLKVHSLTLPSTDYSSGTINNYSTGNSYNYSGTTTTQKTTTYTTGGYTKKKHCRFVSIHFIPVKQLREKKSETSYMMKIKSCGSSSDIRDVSSEMLEAAFKRFGEEGTFKETVYTDVPRGSSSRYE